MATTANTPIVPFSKVPSNSITGMPSSIPNQRVFLHIDDLKLRIDAEQPGKDVSVRMHSLMVRMDMYLQSAITDSSSNHPCGEEMESYNDKYRFHTS